MQTINETFQEALQHHRSGQLGQAEEKYEQVLRIDTSHADAVHMLGVVAFQAGRHGDALGHVQRAIKLKPMQAEYRNTLSTVYRACGRLEEAAESCAQALEISPNYAEAHNTLGNVLRDQGHIAEAKAGFRRALAINPEFQAARKNLESTECDENKHQQTEDSPDNTSSRSTEPENVSGSGRYRVDPAENKVDSGIRTVLHVGCGPKHRDLLHERFHGSEWRELRLDINPDVKPDIVASLTDMQDVADESVDAVWSSHNLEHLYAHDVPVALSEFYRVLRPDGMALISLPDLQQTAELIVADKLDDVIYESPAGPISPIDCLYGLRTAVEKDNLYMAHHTGFTATSLKRHLSDAGFTEIKTWHSPFNLWAEARKS